jgi:xanthine/CO dehydrogenase XdhC/CoxF family maturation factor
MGFRSSVNRRKLFLHLGTTALLDFYRDHLNDESLVLVTIIATEGSTYRKPGAMMLISRDGSFEGMISGGCLEGDLLLHAEEVFSSGQPEQLTYDMHADEDLIWSLGLGCDGVIHLLLQRLDRDQRFGFLPWLENALSTRTAVLLALATRNMNGLAAGSVALLDQNGKTFGEQGLQQVLADVSGPDWPNWRFRLSGSVKAGADENVILVNIPPRTRVLICGAGPDAIPVVDAISKLGWDCMIVDHRPAFARPDRFPDNCTVLQSRPEKLHAVADLDEIDAAVIMSHHLEYDSAYLDQLASRDIPYIGILGPRDRRDRLKEMAGCREKQIFGPAGLDIGAELPESIALSITAEIHAVLNDRSGISLTPET